MVASGNAGTTQTCMRVIADEKSLPLAPCDNEVAVSVAHGAVLGRRDCPGAATKGLAGVRNPELGVAYAERATSKLNSLKIGPSGIRDHHIVRSDRREIGVETLNVDAPVRADAYTDLHVANGGTLHGDMS